MFLILDILGRVDPLKEARAPRSVASFNLCTASLHLLLLLPPIHSEVGIMMMVTLYPGAIKELSSSPQFPDTSHQPQSRQPANQHPHMHIISFRNTQSFSKPHIITPETSTTTPQATNRVRAHSRTSSPAHAHAPRLGGDSIGLRLVVKPLSTLDSHSYRQESTTSVENQHERDARLIRLEAKDMERRRKFEALEAECKRNAEVGRLLRETRAGRSEKEKAEGRQALLSLAKRSKERRRASQATKALGKASTLLRYVLLRATFTENDL
ncbi:hypothetical protein P7C70_g9167, partial [Phenoliferia sp. Uapishka_3]